MSEFENDCAKPLLRRLIVDESATAEWGDLEQLTFAAWAIKTAMVFEHTIKPFLPFFTAEERLAFRDRYEEPPANTWIWAAAYRGSSPHLFHGRHLKLRRNGKHIGNTYVATAVTGYVAFQVVGRRWFEPDDASRFVPKEAGRWKRTTVRIWPPTGRVSSWPPGSPLDDSLLEAFSRRWDDRLRVVG